MLDDYIFKIPEEPKMSVNPKDKFGAQKVSMSCIPPTVLLELALAMTEGALKYGKHNWQESKVLGSIYTDAAMRHMLAWTLGQEIDPHSGIHHITKAIASLTVLRDAQISGNLEDDRPLPHPDLVEDLNPKVADLQKRYGAAA